MICKVKETVEKYKMLSEGCNVTVGVSGGADSCALLLALCSLKDEYKLNLTAVHVNHGIRGKEALRDEEFVKQLCQRLNVPFKVFHYDVPSLAKEMGLGIEECGRLCRYEAFEIVSPNGIIATAHTLSDCCETLIFNITRGTGVNGLASIPPIRGNIIRPLIACTREEVEQYLKQAGNSFVTDSTNAHIEYSRNRIRLEVIPQLKEINPSFEKSAQRLIEAAREDRDYFNLLVKEIVLKARCIGGYDAEIIAKNHIAVRKRLIAYLIEKELDVLPEGKHITSVCGILNGGKTQILNNKIVEVKNGILSFGEKEKTGQWCSMFSLENDVEIPSGKIKFEIIYNNSFEPIQFVHKDVLDYDKICGELSVRCRMAGDTIRIANRNCTKQIKKLLIEEKIQDKNSVAVLADDNGALWVEGFGCDERCKITADTRRVLKIIIRK